MTYKVCVYAICKNEAQFVDRWMDSMNEADMIIVTDTGSEDSTVQLLRDRGAIVYIDVVKPWRFDVARNISLGHVPEDADICVCTDLDEVLLPGWRARLEAAWTADIQAHGDKHSRKASYLYNWSLNADGSPGVQFVYSKVHERRGYTWRWPVHEYLSYDGIKPQSNLFIEGMILNHYPDNAKPRSSYLPLLQMAVEEAPDDARMRYYLGREYMYAGQWEQCIAAETAFLALPSAIWREERCAAMRWIAASHAQLEHFNEAYRWYYRAIAEAPHMRDPYIEFALLCYKRGDWPMTLFLTEQAFTITERSPSYVNMGYSWDFTPDDLCAIAAFRLKLYQKALIHARRALSYAPGDDRLRNNILAVEAAARAS